MHRQITKDTKALPRQKQSPAQTRIRERCMLPENARQMERGFCPDNGCLLPVLMIRRQDRDESLEAKRAVRFFLVSSCGDDGDCPSTGFM